MISYARNAMRATIQVHNEITQTTRHSCIQTMYKFQIKNTNIINLVIITIIVNILLALRISLASTRRRRAGWRRRVSRCPMRRRLCRRPARCEKPFARAAPQARGPVDAEGDGQQVDEPVLRVGRVLGERLDDLEVERVRLQGLAGQLQKKADELQQRASQLK